MNLFLERPWLEAMRATGAVSAVRPVAMRGGETPLHVGEVRQRGLLTWELFGDADPDRLPSLWAAAHAAGAWQVVCRFNMARWREEDLPPEAEITLPFGTYLVDLTQDEETLWAGLHPHHRRAIRKARQGGLSVRPGVEPALLAEMLRATYATDGRATGYNSAYLETLARYLGTALQGFTVTTPAKPVAAMVVPWQRERGWFLHGGRVPDGPPGASPLMHWEAMLWLKKAGVGRYDLGGARPHTDDPRLQGIFTFKARFGGQFVPCVQWRRIVSPPRAALARLLGVA